MPGFGAFAGDTYPNGTTQRAEMGKLGLPTCNQSM